MEIFRLVNVCTGKATGGLAGHAQFCGTLLRPQAVVDVRRPVRTRVHRSDHVQSSAVIDSEL
jgi:hypothetical protein